MTSLSEPSLRRWPLVPMVLLLLAFFDLWLEIQLLMDHFTFTTLFQGIRSHPLAIAVLAFQPSLWNHYRRRQRS